jgi:hypothetical protein
MYQIQSDFEAKVEGAFDAMIVAACGAAPSVSA